MQISLVVEILSTLQFLYYNRLKKYATFITMMFCTAYNNMEGRRNLYLYCKYCSDNY